MRPRITFVVDRPGWAFHHLAAAVSKYLSDEFACHIIPFDLCHQAETDVAVVLWWRAHPTVKQHIAAKSFVTCLYDQVSWNRHPIDICDWQKVLGGTDVVVAGNGMIVDDLARASQLQRPTFICEDGVDIERFKPQPFPEEFTAGWCGDSACGHGDIKGLQSIVEGCAAAGVPLKIADRATGGQVPWTEMPEWYKQISVYICASNAEGTPNPPLEAMACGRPVITTKVGVMPRAVQMWHSGVFVERNAGVIAEALRELQARDYQAMGRAARRAIEPWDWKHKAEAWRPALWAAVEATSYRRPAARKKVAKGTKPRALLVADVPGWAFDQNERDMAETVAPAFDCEHWFVTSHEPPPPMSRFHAVFVPYHRWQLEHYWRGTPLLGSLRSADFDPDQPGVVPGVDAIFLDQCCGFHVVTRAAYDLLHEHFPQVVYLTNPVNMRRFPEPTAVDSIVACWNGNALHASLGQPDVKGYESIIIPACQQASVRLNVAEYNTCRLSPAQMPEFYRRSSVALCASLYEGASNSVMEAMASGLAVIATDVGNHAEMVENQRKHFGDSGILLVERKPEAFAEALRALTPARARAMGRINRMEIEARWSWKAWADRYIDFMRMAVNA